MIAELVAAATVFGGHAPALPLKQCTLARSVAARCGTLAVPEDRRQPSGRKIRIFVGVLRALRRGPHAADAQSTSAHTRPTPQMFRQLVMP